MGIYAKEKLKYPISVFFIISNEFCERFCYYGMRTVLSLYLADMLGYSTDTATVIFHTFTMLVYFFPVLGAMVADSWLGKFNTILYLSIVYALGSTVISLAATPPLNFPATEISMLGLLLIALGTGGIKPCVAAFGGDQFVLPQQQKQLTMFFSMFYFSINAGSLVSTFLTPILRKQECFGSSNCFTLAFGVPAVLMIVSIIIFGVGKPMYTMKKPEGNMLIKCSKCIGNAISVGWKSKDKKEHWLDHAIPEFGAKLVNEVKVTLSVLVLYIPLPIFWALFDQQGSTWTFLARNMDGNIGFYTILPDQMMVVNPVLILIFIPLFEYVIYPIFNKLNILRTPLKRLVAGGALAGVAFLCSAGVSIAVEAEQPVLPTAGVAHLNIYNNLECPLTITSSDLNAEPFSIDQWSYKHFEKNVQGSTTVNYKITSNCHNVPSGEFKLTEREANGYYVKKQNDVFAYFTDSFEKTEDGNPFVRILASETVDNLEVVIKEDDGTKVISIAASNITKHSFEPGEYTVNIGEFKSVKFEFKLGGGYSILVNKIDTKPLAYIKEVTAPNGVHMMWLLPQYIIITMAEIMFSVTGLEFSYSQAPLNMKSVLQSFWLLTTAFGNLIVIIIHSIETFDKQSNDLFLYAGLMFADMIIFTFMAMRYKYVEKKEDEEGEDNEGFDDKKSIEK